MLLILNLLILLKLVKIKNNKHRKILLLILNFIVKGVYILGIFGESKGILINLAWDCCCCGFLVGVVCAERV